jgi:hypothetical protein
MKVYSARPPSRGERKIETRLGAMPDTGPDKVRAWLKLCSRVIWFCSWAAPFAGAIQKLKQNARHKRNGTIFLLFIKTFLSFFF